MNTTGNEFEYATDWRSAAEKPQSLYRHLRWQARRCYLDLVSTVALNRPKKMLKCLCCHYVFDNQIDQFESLILKLKQVGQFVSADECLQMARGQRSIDSCYFHLSFDDGFRNVVTNAMPILTKHQVPATFFVPTELIGADFHAAEQFSCREKYQAPVEFATWDDLRSLDPNLVVVGSHTKNHPRLPSVSGDRNRLVDELAGSKAKIEEQMGYPCNVIAWPGGQAYDIDEVSLEVMRDVGYDAAFGASGGTVLPEHLDGIVIPRQHFEVQWPARHVTYLASL